MGQTGHLSTLRGKRVFVTLRTGEHMVLKFQDRRNSTVYFYDHAPIPAAAIKRLSDYKVRPAGGSGT